MTYSNTVIESAGAINHFLRKGSRVFARIAGQDVEICRARVSPGGQIAVQPIGEKQFFNTSPGGVRVAREI